MIFGYYSYVGYHVPSITVARFVSTVRLITDHEGLRQGVHKYQAPCRRGNYIFYSGA